MANWQRGMLRVMRVTNHPATVIDIHDFTPWYRRITFSAPELVSQLRVFPTLWLRLWVPHPEKPDDVVQRGYTFVDIRAEEGTFALEFVLHDVEGPAGDWAKRATVGEIREVALTPREVVLPEGTTHLVLAGDVTALPAINTWIDEAGHDVPITVVVEDAHPLAELEALPQSRAPRTQWHWVAAGAEHGDAVVARVHQLLEPSGGTYLWAAGEKGLVKAVRGLAKGHLGLDRAHQFSQFYWIEGKGAS